MTLGHLIREEMGVGGGLGKVGQSSSSPKAVCNFRVSEEWNVSGVPQVGAADHKVLLAVRRLQIKLSQFVLECLGVPPNSDAGLNRQYVLCNILWTEQITTWKDFKTK